MLTLMLPAVDDYPAVKLHLEHSLVSLSKWESLHKKSYHSKESMTEEEFRSYISMMVLDDTSPEGFTERLTIPQLNELRLYINDSHTATTFREEPNQPPSREIITSEVIYHWMIAFTIPFDPCQNWHLGRLMALIRVCGIKQSKPKKQSRQQQMAEYKRLNDERRQQLGTSG